MLLLCIERFKDVRTNGIVVQNIEPPTFGMMDGKKLFEQIKQAIPKEK
jgi:cellobiose-specific phosphotransferase system component IIB